MIEVVDGRVKFQRLTVQECKNLENLWIGKRLAYKFKDNKLQLKKGTKKGKTVSYITQEQKDHLLRLDELTIRHFVLLYSTELLHNGYWSVYSKLIRNKKVLQYLLSKNLISCRVKYRKAKGSNKKEPYIMYFIQKDKKESLLEFYVKYLGSNSVDNYEDMKKNFDKVNNTKLTEKLDELNDKYKKTKKKFKKPVKNKNYLTMKNK